MTVQEFYDDLTKRQSQQPGNTYYSITSFNLI